MRLIISSLVQRESLRRYPMATWRRVVTISVASALLSLGVSVADAGASVPPESQPRSRVVEGSVSTIDRKPITEARIFFGQPGVGFVFVEGATATTDALGRY